MDFLNFRGTFSFIQDIISLCGVIIILSGVLIALSNYLYSFFITLIKKTKTDINRIRLRLGRVLVLGLEFIIAADLIGTTTAPDYYSVGILASIVLIRTLLSYTLNRDINLLSHEAT